MGIREKIEQFNEGRNKALLLYKYRAMAENPFRFFRGINHIFWEDLAAANISVQSPPAWICGDLHLENFGSYRSDNRLVYFDLNDFDDALLGNAHDELLRLICSIHVAFDSLEINKAQATKLSSLYLRSYCETLSKGKAVAVERQTAKGILKEFLERSEAKKQKKVIKKRTEKRKDEMRVLIDDSKHIELDASLKNSLMEHMTAWLKEDEASPYNYQIIDAAFRVAGTGSLGLNRYMFLLESSNHTGAKYMLIDMKQAEAPFPQKLITLPQPSWETPAHRIKLIGERMQNRPPALLSTTVFEGIPYIVQELQPEKDSIDFKLLKDRYKDMCRVISDMGVLTASAQLRSAGRDGAAGADDLINFGKSTGWQSELLNYAAAYAPSVKAYYKEFIDNKAS